MTTIEASLKEKAEGLISQLEIMTAKIPSYNPFYFDEKRVMHLETKYGDAVSIGVYSDFNISIAKTIFKANTALKIHKHPEHERIAVLEGELIITLLERGVERKVILPQYHTLDILPNVEHYCSNVEPTVIIADLMPYSKFFPKP